MKNRSVKFLSVLGLVLAIIGFSNFLVQRGGLKRILTAPVINSVPSAIPNASNLPNLTEATASANTYTFTATESGQTAFYLLLSRVPNVKYKQYSFGNFIESINDVAGDTNNFWAFYLNGEKSVVGADAVVLKKGEVVEFKYEKIEL